MGDGDGHVLTAALEHGQGDQESVQRQAGADPLFCASVKAAQHAELLHASLFAPRCDLRLPVAARRPPEEYRPRKPGFASHIIKFVICRACSCKCCKYLAPHAEDVVEDVVS